MSYYVRIEKVDTDVPIAGATFYYDFGDDPDQRYVVTGPIITPGQLIHDLCDEYDFWESGDDRDVRSFRDMATDAVNKSISRDVTGWSFPNTEEQQLSDATPWERGADE